MAHIRQQLRIKVQTLLAAALSRPVFVSRTHLIQPSELPCAIVTIDNDNADASSELGSDRDIELTIRLYERAFSDVDNLIDDLCVLTENAFRNDTTISASQIDLETTSIDIEDGDQQIAVATMIYSVKLFNITDPEQLI